MPAHTSKSQQSLPLLDEKLIEEIGNHDTDAFRIFYHQTANAVYGFVLSILKNQHDAEDVMQDTYLKVRQSAHLYRAQGKPMAWLLTIAKNLSLMKLREAQKIMPVFPEEAELPLDFSVISNSENKLVLEAAFRVLSDTERQIVTLHAITGMKHREIAVILGLPLATVLSKYTRSLAKLKKQLDSTGKEFF